MKAKIQIILVLLVLLSSISVIAQSNPSQIKVVTEQANIRLRPDIGSVIIRQVPKGTILASWEKTGEWYKVELEEGQEQVFGYVHESLVILISPPPPEKIKDETPPEIEEGEPAEPPRPRFIPPSPPPSQPTKPLFDLFLSGGGGFVLGGDINDGAQGLADFYSQALIAEGRGDVDPVRLGLVYGIELSIPLLPNLFVGLGGDYFESKETSRVEYSAAGSDVFLTRPKIQALPVRAFFTFYPTTSFYIKAGVEYTFAKAFYFYRFETANTLEEWRGEAKAQDFGFMGGLGIEWELFKPVRLVVEALGRYAMIKGFEGESSYRDNVGILNTESGKLYIYQGTSSSGGTVPLLFIRETEPSGPDVSDSKEATVNFSGVSVKVGIKIRF